jgi:SAM-dependent methyltransferase
MDRVKSIPKLDDVIEWDIPNWKVALQYWLSNTTHELSSINALEIGARNGGLSLWAALNGIKVLCTDLEGPTNEAIEKHEKYGISQLVRYEKLNALNIPYFEEFDVVLFKSVLGAIGTRNNKNNQIKAINEIYKSLKKGGELWFAENLKASPFHQFLRRRYIEWGETWRYVTVQDMKEFLSLFTTVEYKTVGFLGAFGRNPMQRSLLGTVDRIVGDKLVCESWRYVIIGIAKK